MTTGETPLLKKNGKKQKEKTKKELLKLSGKLTAGALYSPTAGNADGIWDTKLIKFPAEMIDLLPGWSLEIKLRTGVERNEVNNHGQRLTEGSELPGIKIGYVHVLNHAVLKGKAPSGNTLEVLERSFQRTQIVSPVNRHY